MRTLRKLTQALVAAVLDCLNRTLIETQMESQHLIFPKTS